MIVVCRRERETVSFVRILVIAWIVSAPSRSGRGLAGAGDVEEALSEEDPWGKTSKERPVEPSPEPLPVTPSRPVLDVEKFEEWMDQRTLNGMWRNQMVLALGIEHTTRALNAQSAVDEMTNEMFRRNAETLKQGAMDAALASERGIVDVETLRKVNADIILSINEVVKIHEEGSRRRAEAQEELARIEDELKQALLEAGNR
mgnify:CR=1 FL=1